MDLSGTWRARVRDEESARVFQSPEHDDGAWIDVPVPGHWRSVPDLADADGPLLYRRRFDAPAPAPGRRAWLCFEGLFYLGDVWLDGGYTGNTEGYFFPHRIEVTDALRARHEHVLAVEVTCAREDVRDARQLTGAFQHGECADPEWNPGGIWRPVTLHETGPVHLRTMSASCPEAGEDAATLRLRALVDAAEAGQVTLRTAVDGREYVEARALGAGENRVDWTVAVERPRLWWPHALGAQPLVDVSVEITDTRGITSDRRAFRTGLRSVRLHRWQLEVNGERLFLKGSNQGPNRTALAEATAEDLAADVRAAVDTGLDLLRVHGHVSRPELYDAADAAGLLLWQDLPLQWATARAARKQAQRQSRAAVDLLAHHPSVALWGAHNEPVASTTRQAGALPARRPAKRVAASLPLSPWNKMVLDRRLYFGWYHGSADDLAPFLATWPRLARFVSEFGAEAVPESDEFLEPERWPNLDWPTLERRHALQKSVFDRRVPPSEHARFDGWRRATQDYQAALIKRQVEALRVLKYRPTGGFCHFAFADGRPVVSWSVVDHRRRPKLGHAALVAACRSVIVVATGLPDVVRAGDALAVDVHVVNDLRRPLAGVRANARLEWTGGRRAWSWEGDVDADDCTRVGTIQLVVPPALGRLRLALDLVHDEAGATNAYDAMISLTEGGDGRMKLVRHAS